MNGKKSKNPIYFTNFIKNPEKVIISFGIVIKLDFIQYIFMNLPFILSTLENL